MSLEDRDGLEVYFITCTSAERVVRWSSHSWDEERATKVTSIMLYTACFGHVYYKQPEPLASHRA